jgi:hypothetical protein
MDSPSNHKADIALIIGNHDPSLSFNVDRIIQIDINGLNKKLENAMIIKAPLLYGEWMDMTEEGLIIDKKVTRFDSEQFQSESVYIGDFVKATYPVLKTLPNSSNIGVVSKKIFLNESVKLENSIYIRDNIPIEENMKKIMAHYRRFKDFY